MTGARRRSGALGLVAVLLAGCGSVEVPTSIRTPGAASPTSPGSAEHPSRLEAAAGSASPAPAADPAADLSPGTRPLDVGPGREVLVHVPPGVAESSPAGLVVTLHGAGGDARGGLGPLLPLADEHRLLLVSPSSRGSTWDVLRGGWGADVGLVDAAVQRVLGTFPVDPARVAVGGFSDGASYALSLGLANGDLFGHVLAFSPGFVAPVPHVGKPVVFLSHGTADEVLPIERTSRSIAEQLREQGYDVRLREFPGGHTVPPELAAEAVGLLGPPAPPG